MKDFVRARREEQRIGDWSNTFTGRAFYPFDPRTDDVCDEDLAHALSLQCRFGGHCSEFYSVGEHSIRVSWIVPEEHALAGLLHDAAEAYLVDLPRPVKRGIPEYSFIEKRVAAVIGKRYGVDLVNLPASVKQADEILLATEKRDLMPNIAKPWGWLPEPLALRIVPWTPKLTKQSFLDRLTALTRAS